MARPFAFAITWAGILPLSVFLSAWEDGVIKTQILAHTNEDPEDLACLVAFFLETSRHGGINLAVSRTSCTNICVSHHCD